MENQRKIFQWCDCRETDRKSPWQEECLESIFILKISCELLCLMVYPPGIYMPCEMVSVMIQ